MSGPGTLTDGGLCLLDAGERHEAVAARAAGVPIHEHLQERGKRYATFGEAGSGRIARGRGRAAGEERRELPPSSVCDPSGDKPEGTSQGDRAKKHRWRLAAQRAPASPRLTLASRTGEMLPKEAARSSSLTAQGKLPT